jgi:hypothetical protein
MVELKALISRAISHFNDEIKKDKVLTENLITLQVLLTNDKKINNNDDTHTNRYILWHVPLSAIQSNSDSADTCEVTEKGSNKKVTPKIKSIKVLDDCVGYVAKSDPTTQAYVSSESYTVNQLTSAEFSDYIKEKKKTDPSYSAKSVNCSTSRYPCNG